MSSATVLQSIARRCLAYRRILPHVRVAAPVNNTSNEHMCRRQQLHTQPRPNTVPRVWGSVMSKCYSTQSPIDIIVIQDTHHFETEVLASDKPVILQFHASWCQPCKQLAPILEKKLADMKANVLYAKVDIDTHTELAMQYEVQSVPTVLAMKGGDVMDKFVGSQDEDTIEKFIENAADL